jgi:hypothetical protein
MFNNTFLFIIIETLKSNFWALICAYDPYPVIIHETPNNNYVLNWGNISIYQVIYCKLIRYVNNNKIARGALLTTASETCEVGAETVVGVTILTGAAIGAAGEGKGQSEAGSASSCGLGTPIIARLAQTVN